MNEADFRRAVRAALTTLNVATEEAIRHQLVRPLDLGHSGRLQFEVDPFTYGIRLVQSEEDVVPDDAVWDAVPESLVEGMEAAGVDFSNVIAGELVPWFAERWRVVGGPERFRPAYAFFHGTADEPRFDLEVGRWMKVNEVWPDDA